MKKILLAQALQCLPKAFLLFLLSSLLVGCSTLDAAKKETGEAVQNIQTEAGKVTDQVNEKVNQVNQAVDSVNNAVKSVDKAVSDVKAVTSTGQ